MKPRLVLFDIDGTLLTAHGSPKIAMGRVLLRRYPDFNFDRDFDFSGRTDPEIIEYLLEYDNREVSDALIADILREFCIELDIELAQGEKPELHPGVMELLTKLDAMPDISLGLVTGNVAEGARIKLKAASLDTYFPVGGFGDDSKYRDDLPPFALERAEKYYGKKFPGMNTWIIGDSIHDIRCAQNNRLRCLAVCTGWTSRENLIKENPEYIEDDLSRIDHIMNLIYDGAQK